MPLGNPLFQHSRLHNHNQCRLHLNPCNSLSNLFNKKPVLLKR
jgi:hypothetical protein